MGEENGDGGGRETKVINGICSIGDRIYSNLKPRIKIYKQAYKQAQAKKAEAKIS